MLKSESETKRRETDDEVRGSGSSVLASGIRADNSSFPGPYGVRIMSAVSAKRIGGHLPGVSYTYLPGPVRCGSFEDWVARLGTRCRG